MGWLIFSPLFKAHKMVFSLLGRVLNIQPGHVKMNHILVHEQINTAVLLWKENYLLSKDWERGQPAHIQKNGEHGFKSLPWIISPETDIHLKHPKINTHHLTVTWLSIILDYFGPWILSWSETLSFISLLNFFMVSMSGIYTWEWIFSVKAIE